MRIKSFRQPSCVCRLDQSVKGLAAASGGVTFVLRAKDVAIEGFCVSRWCRFHDSALARGLKKEKFAYYTWVGNSERECPGQVLGHGPQTSPLAAPRCGRSGHERGKLVGRYRDNPYGNGYFRGSASAPAKAASACLGMYGENAYPGELLVDSGSDATFYANGINGRRYLLPALWNPETSPCSSLV